MYLIYTKEYEQILLGLLFNKTLIDDVNPNLRNSLSDPNALFNVIAFNDSTDWRNPPDLLSPPIPPSPVYDVPSTASGWLEIDSSFSPTVTYFNVLKKVGDTATGQVPKIDFYIHFVGSSGGSWTCTIEFLEGTPNVLQISVPVSSPVTITQTFLGHKLPDDTVIPLIYISHPTILLSSTSDSYYMRHMINMFVPSIYRT